MDFMSDQLATGRCFRILNVVDDYSQECVGQMVDFSISGQRSRPEAIVTDNGPEFTSKAMFLWSQRIGIDLRFIQPGKPHPERAGGKLQRQIPRCCVERR